MKERLNNIEAELDRKQYGQLMPEFFMVSFEKKFKRAHYARHADRDMLTELRKVNRGDVLWCGLYRAVFLPDRYDELFQFEQATGALYDALEPFGLKMSGIHPFKRELRLVPAATLLARGSKLWSEQKAASDKFLETAKQFGVKL